MQKLFENFRTFLNEAGDPDSNDDNLPNPEEVAKALEKSTIENAIQNASFNSAQSSQHRWSPRQPIVDYNFNDRLGVWTYMASIPDGTNDADNWPVINSKKGEDIDTFLARVEMPHQLNLGLKKNEKLFENWRDFRKESLNESRLGAGMLEQAFKSAAGMIYEDKSYALHMRAFGKYISGNTNVFTEKDLTEEEKEKFSNLLSFVKERRISAAKNFASGISPKGKKWGEKTVNKGKTMLKNLEKGYFGINYEDYPRRQDLGAPRSQAGIPMTGGDFAEQIERFIGRASRISFTDDYFIVHDIYDFAQLTSAEKAGIDSFYDAAVNFIDIRSLTPKGLYIKIRKLAPYIGKPYRVRIKLDNLGPPSDFSFNPDTLIRKKKKPPLARREKVYDGEPE